MIQLPTHLGSICFPAGGAGNHLRWLLFLDKKFIFKRLKSVQEKIDFIKDRIYPPERTWYNWLSFEYEFRIQLNGILTVGHFLKELSKIENSKTLVLYYSNLNEVFNQYYYINVNLNSQTMDQFKSYIKDSNNQCQQATQKNAQSLLADPILNDELDYNFYKQVVDFFELDDQYREAKIVHSLYKDARARAFRDFYNHFTSKEFHEYCDIQLNKNK